MSEVININTRIYGDPEEIKMAVRHDYLLYKDKEPIGMKEDSLYEWTRFIINRRLNEIVAGIK